MSLRHVAAWVVAFSVLAAQAFALPADDLRHHQWKRHTTQPSHFFGQRDHFPRPYAEYTGWSRSPQGGWVYFGSSYTFVPHRGIIDEACNLPTSACPNSQRDVN